jgi:hypothetical protein
MIDQIRQLQKQSEPFAIELTSGRVIQIYEPHSVATDENGHGTVGVLHGNGAFEIIPVAQIVSVSVGVHPIAKERMEAARERARKLLGK